MTKYKLIDTYPNSLPIGSIVVQTEHGYDYINHPGKCRFFSTSEIENYPRFWEKVVEKDYGILSVKCKRTEEIYKGYEFELVNKLKTNKYTVYSVKRLSDGEVFTVGDRLQLRMSNDKWWNNDDCILYKIAIFSNELRFYIDQKQYKNACYSNPLKDWRKAKMPIFQSEDGVDIFEGDIVYSVLRNPSVGDQVLKIKVESERFRFAHRVYFTKRKTAEKWIDENEPIYSKKQIRDALMYDRRNQNPYPDYLDVSRFCRFLNID